jgi:two-component system phosphate regulon sensor histidine kinase PhoR
VRAVDRELRAARDREGFVAATTHELKTPLAAIKLFAELLPDPELDAAKRVEFAGRIGAEADRLARLVGAVLDFARLERSSPEELRVRFVECDLGDRLRGVVETFRPVAAAQGFDVGWTAPDMEVRVLGDPDALGGALLNLLDNAVKYGGKPHRIEAAAIACAPGRVAFTVADRGPGVPAAERRRVFEPFVRMGDEMTREKKGVGLGLALVLRVAEAHGGAARVEPRDGGGSVFVVELPAARPTYDAAARSPSA